ncbi:MAG: hypothetical protein HY242_12495 [Afipia sp.]|nr:hypothetical protein [Afipia sp.]
MSAALSLPEQTSADEDYPRDSLPARGSPQWSERVLDIFERDCIDDFEELCLLMGVI